MAIDPAADALDPPAAAVAAEFGAAYCAELDEAALIRRYVPLVKRLALHLKGRLPETVQLDDLVQAGLIAVLRLMRRGAAAQIRDPPLNRAIVNAMIDEARREVWAPVRVLRLAKAAAQAIATLKRRLGRDADDEEVAAELGMGLAAYHAALVEIAGIRLLQIDAFQDRDAGALPVVGGSESGLDREDLLAALARSIAALPDREKLVVSLYYEQELNMDEVGKVLGLDKSTVCRTHGRALLMLRAALAEGGERTAPSAASGG